MIITASSFVFKEAGPRLGGGFFYFTLLSEHSRVSSL